MRILILALSPFRGMLHYASQMANALATNQELEVTIILNPYAPKNLFPKNVQLIYFYPKKLIKIPSVFSYVKLYRIISKINPDIIHDPIGSGYYWTAFLKPLLKKWPLVLTLHDPKPHSGMSYLYKLINRCFINYINLKTADLIYVHGNNCRKYLIKKKIPERKIQVISHGDYSFFNKNRKYIKKEDNTVLFFGTMRLNKGIDRLYDIAEKVKVKIPTVKFIIAGSSHIKWTKKNRIKKIINSMKSSPMFEVHDKYIPDDEVEIYFRRASVVILPYYDASQSGIIPIAYPFGKPVVATRVGDLPEVVTNGVTGYICDPFSNQEIADRIITLLKDDYLRKEIGNNAYNFYLDNLSWNIISKIIFTNYLSLINQNI